MVDLQSVSAVLSALKAASDLTRGMIGLSNAEAIRAKVIELQQAILDAQQAALDAQRVQGELQDRVRELEAQLRKRVSKPCPICGQDMKTISVTPDSIFGGMGLQSHTLRRDCGHSETRQVDPAKD